MANTKVTGDVIANGTISTVHIADDAITAAKLDSTATGITFADLAVDTDTLYVDSANNRVGIGTSSPSYKLGLSNSNTLTAVYQQFTNGTTGTTSSDGTVMGIDADGDFLINNQEAKEIKLYTSDTQRLTIQSGGNVGIGTTNPSTILDVRNSINIGGSGQDSNIYFQQNTSNQARINYYTDNSMYFDNWNGGYYFRTTSSFTPRVTILNGGNVGIGTDLPSNILHVHQSDASSNAYLHITHQDGGSAATDGISIGLESDGVNAVIRNRENGYLRMFTNNTERMRITSAGDVQLVGNKYLYANPSAGSTTIGAGFQLDAVNNIMKLWTNDIERMRIDSSGDLTMQGGRIYLKESDLGNNAVAITRDADEGYVQLFSSGTQTIQIRGNGDSYFNGGNVGIGTTSPGAKLHIADTTTMTSGQSSVEVLKLQRIDSGGDIKASTEGHISMWATDSNSNTEWARISWLNDDSSDSGLENRGSLSFWTSGGGTLDRAMYIDHNRNVGIGTTNPSARLNVYGTGSANDPTLAIDTTSSSTFNHAIEAFNANLTANEGNYIFVGKEGSTKNAGYIGYKYSAAGSNNNILTFGHWGSDNLMNLTANGKLGIGTTSPSEILHLASTGSVRIKLEADTNNITETDNPQILFSQDGGAVNASIGFEASGGGTDNNFFIWNTYNSPMRFATNNTERMRIASGNDIFFGTQSTTYPTANNFVHINTASSYSMVIGGHSGTHTAVLFRHNGTASVGSIIITSSSTSYNTSSDYRLKENVVEMTGALDRVSQLKPSRFNFIADADKTVDGFLAHEVQDIVPEAITGAKDEVDVEGNPVYQGIDQSKLVPLLVGAIQEQQEIINDLKNRIQTLENN